MVWVRGAPTNATRIKEAALFCEKFFFQAPMAAIPASPAPKAEPMAAKASAASGPRSLNWAIKPVSIFILLF